MAKKKLCSHYQTSSHRPWSSALLRHRYSRSDWRITPSCVRDRTRVMEYYNGFLVWIPAFHTGMGERVNPNDFSTDEILSTPRSKTRDPTCHQRLSDETSFHLHIHHIRPSLSEFGPRTNFRGKSTRAIMSHESVYKGDIYPDS